jgi:sensor histidine kinase regulating citrate/malate metabolism
MVDILAECYRRASRAREHQHMVDLMAIAGLLCKGLTEAEVMQAKLKAED